MKIYTRTGDKGTTSLVGGHRVSKTHERIEAYGTVDELNAQLGLLNTYLSNQEDKKTVLHIQNVLFNIGAELATYTEESEKEDDDAIAPKETDEQQTSTAIHPKETLLLEDEIDRLDKIVPPLRAFVLPGGSRGASVAHVCRTVCRRAERRILALSEQSPIDGNLIAYINRLSDYLFLLARKINFDGTEAEILWEKDCK